MANVLFSARVYLVFVNGTEFINTITLKNIIYFKMPFIVRFSLNDNDGFGFL